MKVTYVSINEFPSRTADSIHTMKMCQAFVQEGHDVELVAPRRGVGPFKVTDDLWDYYGLTTEFPITYLPWPGDWGKVLFRGLAALYSRRRSDSLVYSRCLPTAALASKMNKPTIWEHHQMIGTRAQNQYFRWLARSQKFLGMVVVSEALRRAYLEQFEPLLNAPDIMAIHDGVDLERFDRMPSRQDARIKLGLNPDQFLAGYIGHLYPGRGVEQIFELAKQLPDIRFMFVGGAHQDIENRTRQAADQELANVHFAGFVANSKLPAYYAACDVLLMPYQREVAVSGGGNTASYMSPMKMFEYMATGRMIIASDMPVLREVLDETNAVLCAPEDIPAWREALQRAQVDVTWSDRLAEAAINHVKTYTWKLRVRNILEKMT
jgi:glycosyltransferase involved in cell wall biosynthesis